MIVFYLKGMQTIKQLDVSTVGCATATAAWFQLYKTNGIDAISYITRIKPAIFAWCRCFVDNRFALS
jgi:hypothetical protein